jgi:hypothetical protein
MATLVAICLLGTGHPVWHRVWVVPEPARRAEPPPACPKRLEGPRRQDRPVCYPRR